MFIEVGDLYSFRSFASQKTWLLKKKFKFTIAEEDEMVKELMAMCKNTKTVNKLVTFKQPKDDFYSNEYSDIDKYMDNESNGCPIFDASVMQALSEAELDQYMERIKSLRFKL